MQISSCTTVSCRSKATSCWLGLHVTKDAFGWTSLALAGNGGMKGASQIVVRKEDERNVLGTGTQWVVEDRNSQDYSTPELDKSQDVKLLFADQDEDTGETWWGVLLPISSCDEMDYSIRDVSVFMLWALGNQHTFTYHGDRRGQFHANLMHAPEPKAVENDDDEEEEEEYEELEVLMPNVHVVLGEGGTNPTNPYLCAYYDLAELLPDKDENATLHLTRMTPLISEESKPPYDPHGM